MRVLHFVAGNLNDGAARGAYWLHKGVIAIGVDSYLLTNSRETYGDPTVTSLNRSEAERLRYSLRSRIGNLPINLYRNRKSQIFNTGIAGIDVTKHPLYKDADIIHLHWVNSLVSMHSLQKVNKPLIWTMRDMWPMTGGCHYSMDCDHYESGCGKCPQLGSHKAQDLSALTVKYKRYVLPSHMRLVGISEWLSSCAEKSAVFKGFDIRTIQNNIDTTQFTPVEKIVARRLLKLDTMKKVVLIGANNVNDFYKGFSLFCDALQYLSPDEFHLLVFGKADKNVLDKLGFEYTALGHLTDNVALRVAYSAADVFVAPSRMDAFGKTLVEAMSCGTPVVCFDATGPKDIVSHKETGYKASPFDSEDLTRGIKWVLSRTTDEYEEISDAARTRAVARFDSSVIASQYRDLYKECLAQKSVKA